MRSGKCYGLGALGLLTLVLTSCPARPSTIGTGIGAKLDAAACRQRLDSAHLMVVKKSFISLEKKYAVYVDGSRVGTVTGKIFPVFGDTFTFTSAKGSPILAEREVKRTFRLSIDRLAVVTDPGTGRELGYVAQNQWRDLLNWGIVFHVFDMDQREIGQARQQFSLFLKESTITGTEEEHQRREYGVKQVLNMFQNTYDISISEGPHSISPEMAVLIVCIEDAIWSAQHAKGSKRR